ncbi:MAG: LamG domain-containing protein [Sedimentisphaerales bacterium]|nr:LamG domain-containing protein [Sedimentisphaerales bacterium]
MKTWRISLFLVFAALQTGVLQAGVPAPVGVWEFNAPDPNVATVGADLELVGDCAITAGIDGGDGAVIIGEGSYYRCTHGISANGGGGNVNEWTLLIDFSYPTASLDDLPNGYNDLLQCDPTFTQNAAWTIKGNPSDTPGSVGIGAVGYSDAYGYVTQPETWYRMVVPIDNDALFDLYMDGVKIFAGNPQAVDSPRFSLQVTSPDDVVLLFASNDGDDAPIRVSTVALWDQPLTYQFCRALKGPGDTLDPINLPPIVDAGVDQNLQWTGSSLVVNLDGTVTDDGSYSVSWTKVSGPDDIVIDTPDAEDTTATISAPGRYVLQLTATDPEFVESDTMSVTVINADGLLVYWDFEETWNGTTVTDQSGLGNDGTVVDRTVGTSTYIPGLNGQSLELDNYGEGGRTKTQADFISLGLTLPDSGTILMWFKPYHYYNYNVIFDNSVDPDDWECWIYEDSRLHTRIDADSYAGTNLSVLSPGDPNQGAGSWWHVASTWERSGGSVEVKLYINGVLMDTGNGPWVNPGTTFFLGGGNNGNYGGEGAYDDVMIFNRALSEQEILGIVYPGNTPPIVNAGEDREEWLDIGGQVSFMLDGAVSDDGNPVGQLDVLWTKVSGPDNIVIDTPDSEDTQVTFTAPGTYELQLEGDDTQFVTTDNVIVKVYPYGYTGLIVHWPCETTDPNTGLTDVSGNSNDGVYVDGAVGDAAMVPGKPGRALDLINGDFAADGDYVSLDLTLPDAGTIALWYNVAPLYNSQTILDNSSDLDDWECWINSDGLLVFRLEYRGQVDADLTAIAPDSDPVGKWFHVATTWNKTSDITVDVKLFINGALQSRADNGPWIAPGDYVYLAGGNPDNDFGDGVWDDVRIYERALSPQEIEILASMSDYDDDMDVDIADFQVLASYWLSGAPGCDATPPFDYNMDCDVTLEDFAEFSKYYLLNAQP